jgi:hypothetical protein
MINRVHNRAAPSSEVELRQRESSTCRSVRTRSIRLSFAESVMDIEEIYQPMPPKLPYSDCPGT